MGPNLGKNLYPSGFGVLWHCSLVPDFSKSGTGTARGESPRFRTNRGRGRGSVPAPGQIGDGRPVPVTVPGQIGDGEWDGDRGVRALRCAACALFKPPVALSSRAVTVQLQVEGRGWRQLGEWSESIVTTRRIVSPLSVETTVALAVYPAGYHCQPLG